jgi:DNA-binding IclR family transcriptional regulator
MTQSYDIMHAAHSAAQMIDAATEAAINITVDREHNVTIYHFADDSVIVANEMQLRSAIGKVLPLYTVNADPKTGDWLDEPQYLDHTPADGWSKQTDEYGNTCDTYEHNGQTRAVLITWSN